MIRGSTGDTAQPADYKVSQSKNTGKGNMISGAKQCGLWLWWYSESVVAFYSSFGVVPSGKCSPEITFHYPSRLQLHQDGWCIFNITSERWKRADVFDSSLFLSPYQDEGSAPLSLIQSTDKLSPSQSPLFMLCLVTVARLCVWMKALLIKAIKWRLNERDPRSIRIKGNVKGKEKG